jgi:hypothetical protein
MPPFYADIKQHISTFQALFRAMVRSQPAETTNFTCLPLFTYTLLTTLLADSHSLHITQNPTSAAMCYLPGEKSLRS